LKTQGISAKELLSVIPDEVLVNLSLSTGVNYQVKKLYGRSMFYLLLYGLLESRVSLRSLEDTFNSTKFKVLFRLDRDARTKYNSISDRLSMMDEEYFRQAYKELYKGFSALYSPKEGLKYNITRVDSTMVVEVANKIKEGMVVGTHKEDGPKQVKFTMGLTNLLPSSVEVYTNQQFLSEDIAIPQAVKSHMDKSKDNVFVFDRGVSSRKAFNELDNEELRFVTRINPSARHEVVESNTLRGSAMQVGNLRVVLDERVVLFDKHHKRSNTFRLLQSEDEQGAALWFLTNMMQEEPKAIIDIYKKRWDIEVFFRFIKQELNFKHFISTSINGISIILYMTLILAMLILIYKRLNGVGYKTAVRRFLMEVDELYMSQIIAISGGDPSLVFR
jgi:IS4 transposase